MVNRLRALINRLLVADGKAEVLESWDSGDAACLSVKMGKKLIRIEIRPIN